MKINKRYYVYVGVIVVLVGAIFSINILSKDNSSINSNIAFFDESNTTKEVLDDNTFYVDVKGSVKKPGVYKATSDMIVNDVIKLAGGLNKSAYTKNINLATKVKEGMVIYIYSNSEVRNTTNKIINDVTCTTEVIKYDTNEKTTTNVISLININTASKDQLMTLTGIGESKALAIIEYRNKTPFNTIEDIMNVSGIGESAFAKIKGDITV